MLTLKFIRYIKLISIKTHVFYFLLLRKLCMYYLARKKQTCSINIILSSTESWNWAFHKKTFSVGVDLESVSSHELGTGVSASVPTIFFYKGLYLIAGGEYPGDTPHIIVTGKPQRVFMNPT